MKLREQRALQDLLGELRGDPAFHHLEERAQVAGHLEDADYQRLLEAEEDCESVRNLRRHVLFCGVCAEEFLQRAAPRTEEDFERGDRRLRTRRIVLVATLFICVALGTRGFLAWRKERGLQGTTPPRAVVLNCRTVEARKPGEKPRVQAEVRCPGVEELWVYAFVRDGESIRVLGPDPLHGVVNPQRVGSLPVPGWVLPEGLSSPELILFAASSAAPALEDPFARKEAALHIQELIKKGHLLADLLPSLRRELLPGGGWVQRVVIER